MGTFDHWRISAKKSSELDFVEVEGSGWAHMSPGGMEDSSLYIHHGGDSEFVQRDTNIFS